MKDSLTKLGALSPSRRAALLCAIALQIGLLVAAELDIQRRPAGAIRGGKARWRVVSLINFVGPLSYFRWGRRAA
jgi:hypothetical protein